jgi:hypothetical protein
MDQNFVNGALRNEICQHKYTQNKALSARVRDKNEEKDMYNTYITSAKMGQNKKTLNPLAYKDA